MKNPKRCVVCGCKLKKKIFSISFLEIVCTPIIKEIYCPSCKILYKIENPNEEEKE